MIVKRFYADTSREALRLVRQALGEDALILGNRRTLNGVEISAVAQSEVNSVTAAVTHGRAEQLPQRREETFGTRSSSPGDAPAAVQAEEGPASYGLVHEVRLLRSLVEGQLAAFAWTDLKRRDPAKLEAMRRMLAAGFGAMLTRQMIEELPDGLDLERVTRLTKARLQQRLLVVPPSAGLVEEGGVFALVGPTGVGKTTTVAKLAAECALKYGAGRLALITTDTYRIGAVDQLRIYGKILNVPVFAIRNEADLQSTLLDLRPRHLVLIDTVGMSQRDRRVAEQVALLGGRDRRVRRVLLLSAVSQGNVLEEVVRAYGGAELAGAILTKVDEALTLGNVLDMLVRHKLVLHYVTNGQRVPEDLHRPNALYLVERAFRAAAQFPAPDDAEAPLTLAAGQN